MKAGLALTVLVGLLAAFPASGQEVRYIAVRDRGLTNTGDLEVYLSFLSGHGKVESQLDPSLLFVEVDGKRVSGTSVTTVPFQDSGKGLAVLIEVDVSGSMKTGLPKIKSALRSYVGELRQGLDVVAIGAIAADWNLMLDFTKDLDLAARTIDQLEATAPTTALFESVFEGTRILSLRGKDTPTRRLIVVVTDGLNEKAGRTPSDCVVAGRDANIQVHSLIFLAREEEKFLVAKGQMETISRDTGGSTFTTSDPGQIPEAVQRLQSEMSRETVLAISAAALPKDGHDHVVRIRYGEAVTEFRFVASLVVAPSTGVSADVAPVTSPGKKGLKIEPWIFALAGVVLLSLVLVIWILSRKRSAARRAFEQSRQYPAEQEQVDAEPIHCQEFADSFSSPVQDYADGSEVRDFHHRKTEYRPPENSHRITRLRVEDGVEGIAFISLSGGSQFIGADSSNDIVIDAPSVSGRHALIVEMADGLGILDSGSTNGTFVDGIRAGAEPVALRPGCKLCLGMVVLLCE